ncbi:MAG: sulfotransferase [Pirellulales bacterium]
MTADIRPIFVVGSPRSGTTLMRSILDAHPSIVCPPWETGIFVALADLIERYERTQAKHHFLEDEGSIWQWTRQVVDDLMARVTGSFGKPRWAEKTPAHVLHIELIHRVYPQAQFVHIIRNGYEVVRSLQNMTWAPHYVRGNASTWVNYVRAGRQAARALPAGLYHELRYDELVAKPEGLLRQLCDFLGEPFEPQMLAFDQPQNNTFGATREPIMAEVKRDYRELTRLQRWMFNSVAGSLMRELGYR